MIDKNLIPVGGLKKEPFSGEHHGMRYLFQCDEGQETFTVFVYPEPWSFDKTPDAQKQSASFPMNNEGMDGAVTWLWEMYNTRQKEWNTAWKNRMHI